jgi:quinol monooxygenase YgiN
VDKWHQQGHNIASIGRDLENSNQAGELDMPAESNTSTANNSAMLAHMVYFSLKEPTSENIQKMLAACHKYLIDHPGQVFYAAGTCASYDRPVNDRDFDIALQTVFADRAAHDAYQAAPRHKQFIAEHSSMWAKVRVFDADVAKP